MIDTLDRAVLPAADGQPAIVTEHAAAFQEAVTGAARIVEEWLAQPSGHSVLEVLGEWRERTPATAYPAFHDGFLLRLQQRLRASPIAPQSDSEDGTSLDPAASLAAQSPVIAEGASRPMRGTVVHRQGVARRIAGLSVRLMLLTGARLVQVQAARWSEFDLGARVWRIPAERVPGGAAHSVPLTSEAIGTLNRLLDFVTLEPGADWLLPDPADVNQALSRDYLASILADLGYVGAENQPDRLLRDELVASQRFALALIAQHFDGAPKGHVFDLAAQHAMLQAWADHMADACAIEVPSYRQLRERLALAQGWRYE